MTGTDRKCVIVFGDESGIPLAVGTLPNETDHCVVFDPRRDGMYQFVRRHFNGVTAIAHPDKRSRVEFEARIKYLCPSLGLVVSYGRILWPKLIDLFPLGVVNLHGGRLPEYRGANVLQWAIINGETETDVTLHYVDEGIDTGPVIGKRRVPIDDDDTALSLKVKTSMAARDLLSDWLPQLVSDRVPASVQNEDRSRVWPRRTADDGLIDWSWPDERIRNLTRALVKPWPGAFYLDRNNKKIVVEGPLTIDEIRRIRRDLTQ